MFLKNQGLKKSADLNLKNENLCSKNSLTQNFIALLIFASLGASSVAKAETCTGKLNLVTNLNSTLNIDVEGLDQPLPISASIPVEMTLSTSNKIPTMISLDEYQTETKDLIAGKGQINFKYANSKIVSLSLVGEKVLRFTYTPGLYPTAPKNFDISIQDDCSFADSNSGKSISRINFAISGGFFKILTSISGD